VGINYRHFQITRKQKKIRAKTIQQRQFQIPEFQGSQINGFLQLKLKKRPEATQTLRAGCSKADPQTNTHKQTGAITMHCAA